MDEVLNDDSYHTELCPTDTPSPDPTDTTGATDSPSPDPGPGDDPCATPPGPTSAG
ncbi:hypothetical protein [Streptomyces sp. NPDC005181]|uniref:hypothetical protein n=1 Tax=Streptomyces sp. NPDC005181 TaxID=3156869 RepID=UPI0033B1D7A5